MSAGLFHSLPVEVLNLILDLVPEQRPTCMQLSRFWREFILQTPPAHLTVDLRKKELNSDLRRGLKQQLRLNPPSLTWLSSSADINEVVLVLHSARCTKLEKLVIRDCREYDGSYGCKYLEKDRRSTQAALHKPSFIKKWACVTQHLTHLDMVASAYNCDGLLEFILMYTPRLVSLSFHTFADVEAPFLPFDKSSHGPAHTNLRYLRWQGTPSLLEDLDFVSFFLPNLELMHLLDDTEALIPVESNSPSLDNLLQVIQFLPHLVDWSFFSDFSQEPPVNAAIYPRLGLRTFVMEGIFLVDQELVLDVARQNHDTLIQFCYCPHEHNFYSSVGTSPNPPVLFPCLKDLYLDEFTICALEDLLPHCPALESLSLARMETKPELMDLLHTQPWRDIRVDWDSFEAGTMERLVKNAIASGPRCTLKNIVYDMGPCDEKTTIEDLLPYLGELCTLETLIINDTASKQKVLGKDIRPMREFACNAVRSGLAFRLKEAWFGCLNKYDSNSEIKEFLYGILSEGDRPEDSHILY